MKTFIVANFALMLVIALINVPGLARGRSTAAGTPAAAAVAVSSPEIYGFFFIKGRAPVGFRDIDFLDITIMNTGDPNYHGQIRLKGRAMRSFRLQRPTLGGTHISFRTRTVGGIHYEFDGTLSQADFKAHEPNGEETALQGTLKKVSAGKVLNQAELRFSWSVGD